MILSALTRYYYRLAAQEDRLTGEAKVPSYGFSEEKIGWVLELDFKGKFGQCDLKFNRR